MGRRPTGSSGELDAGHEGLLFLNTVLLLAALAGISLAASASFDRLGPAIAIGVAVVLLGYLLEILGQLWPDAEVVQPYSPFHYLRPFAILGGQGEPDGPAGPAGRVRASRWPSGCGTSPAGTWRRPPDRRG